MLRPENIFIKNQIRPLAFDSKNYLFAGSHRGVKYGAISYSLFATDRVEHAWPVKEGKLGNVTIDPST